jgi:hypothetical protein
VADDDRRFAGIDTRSMARAPALQSLRRTGLDLERRREPAIDELGLKTLLVGS